MMIRSICIFLLFVAIGCASKKAKEPETVFGMRKTACLGMCPVYEMKIFSDGKVWLNAEANLSMMGIYESKINKKSIEALKEMFVEAGIFNFDDSYDSEYTDLPTTFVLFKADGRVKEIKDYFGAPEELKILENKLAALIDQLEWTKAG